MRTIKKSYLMTALLVLLAYSATAQDKAHAYLSLEQAIDSALLHNESLRQATYTARIAKEQSRGANAVFMPQVDLSYNAYFTNNPLNAFGFKLQEQQVSAADFDPTRLNHPGFNKDFSSQIEVVQPLFNLDAIFQRSSARAYAEMQEWSQKRREEYLVFQVKQAYAEVALAHQSAEVMKQALETSRTFLKRADDMAQQGVIQKADFLEAQVFEQQMATAHLHAVSQIANSSDQLSLLMGQPSGTIYRVDAIHLSDRSIPALNLHSRTDILAYQAGLSAVNHKLKASKMTLIPRINAFGNYQFNDPKPFRFGSDSYFAGIRLSWKLFSGTQNWHQIKAAKWERQQMVSRLNEAEAQAQAEYQKSLRELTDLTQEARQVATVVMQAQEALTIQTDRYQQGLSTTADLLRIQTRLSEAQLREKVVTFKQNLTKAYLAFLTSTNY